MRVYGPAAECVVLRLEFGPEDALPVVKIKNGSLASSEGMHDHHPQRDRNRLPHCDGARRQPVGVNSFVSVVTEQCVFADALTKVVLSRGKRSEPLLRSYGATAYLHTLGQGWRRLGMNA